MPTYLRGRRSWFLNYGRTIKTRLRCDTHDLYKDTGRRDDTPPDDRICEYCNLDMIETVEHFALECTLYDEVRLVMLERIDGLTAAVDHFGWRRKNWKEKLQFLLGDGPDLGSTSREALSQWSQMETAFYFYLHRAHVLRRDTEL